LAAIFPSYKILVDFCPAGRFRLKMVFAISEVRPKLTPLNMRSILSRKLKGTVAECRFRHNLQILVNFFENFLSNITILPKKFSKKFPQNCENSVRKSIRRQSLKIAMNFEIRKNRRRPRQRASSKPPAFELAVDYFPLVLFLEKAILANISL
jgi:hypothetical protein